MYKEVVVSYFRKLDKLIDEEGYNSLLKREHCDLKWVVNKLFAIPSCVDIGMIIEGLKNFIRYLNNESKSIMWRDITDDYYKVNEGVQLEKYIKDYYLNYTNIVADYGVNKDNNLYYLSKISRAIEYVYRLGKNTVGDIKKQYIRDLDCAIWELKQITGGSNE